MMKQSYDEDRYYRLLDYLKQLFKRENLCHNTYLFKKMEAKLTLPLYAIAEEKAVAAISRDYDLIREALEQSGLVRVQGRQVRIIEHPTLKINIRDHVALRQLEDLLQQREIKYEISKRYDQDQYVNLTVFTPDASWLQTAARELGKQVDFERADLLEDMKFGVDRIRKLKVEHARQKTTVGKQKYSLQQPPEVFVRKAIESSDEEDEAMGTGPNAEKTNNGSNGRNYKQKTYKARARKIKLHEQDFPQLIV